MSRPPDPTTAHRLGPQRLAAIQILAAGAPIPYEDFSASVARSFLAWGYAVYSQIRGKPALTITGRGRLALQRWLGKQDRAAKKAAQGPIRPAYRPKSRTWSDTTDGDGFNPTRAMRAAHAYRPPTAGQYEADPALWDRDAEIHAAWAIYQRERDPGIGVYDVLRDSAWLRYEVARDAAIDRWRARGGRWKIKHTRAE